MAGNEPMGMWDALLHWLRSLFFGREMEIVVIGAFAVGRGVSCARVLADALLWIRLGYIAY